MTVDLGTTNLLLGILAAVSAVQAIIGLWALVAMFSLYRRLMTVIEEIEARQLAPAAARVNAILDDVKGVTARVKEETERVDQAIRTTIDRVDETADRVRTNVRAKTNRLVGLIRGVRVAVDAMLEHRHQRAGQPTTVEP